MVKKDIHVCVYTHTHTHTRILLNHKKKKKNEIMPSAVTWMELEIIILSETSQKEKDNYHMMLLICGI